MNHGGFASLHHLKLKRKTINYKVYRNILSVQYTIYYLSLTNLYHESSPYSESGALWKMIHFIQNPKPKSIQTPSWTYPWPHSDQYYSQPTAAASENQHQMLDFPTSSTTSRPGGQRGYDIGDLSVYPHNQALTPDGIYRWHFFYYQQRCLP